MFFATNLRRLLPWCCAGLAFSCSPESPSGEGEGEGEGEDCWIGDPTAPVEDLHLVTRNARGEVVPLADGDTVDLVLPPQGGKVMYIGVAGRNLSCHLLMRGGVFDACQDPRIVVGFEGRTVEMIDDGTGMAVPINSVDDYAIGNLVNIPMCPAFSTSVDMNDRPWPVEIVVTELVRPGEDEPRRHTLTTTIVPQCAFADETERAACECECDAEFNLTMPQEQQCSTIHDNDVAADSCPIDDGT